MVCRYKLERDHEQGVDTLIAGSVVLCQSSVRHGRIFMAVHREGYRRQLLATSSRYHKIYYRPGTRAYGPIELGPVRV